MKKRQEKPGDEDLGIKKIKTSSAKAKGRRLQNWVAQKVSEITGIFWGKDKLIQGQEMGQKIALLFQKEVLYYV